MAEAPVWTIRVGIDSGQLLVVGGDLDLWLDHRPCQLCPQALVGQVTPDGGGHHVSIRWPGLGGTPRPAAGELVVVLVAQTGIQGGDLGLRA